MSVKSNLDLEQDPRSIIGTRVLDAPRELVFSVWTDPKHLAQWWGPNGFTTTTHTFDFRPGGAWRHTMHAPDGNAFENDSEFIEIDRPNRISFLHKGPMHKGPLSPGGP